MTVLGELIGLARAAEGNEDLLTGETAAVFAEGLVSPGEGTVGKILAETRRLVPDCFSCQNPCGRIDAYDTERLADEPEDVRAAKETLLERAWERCLGGVPDEETLRRICNALQLIGIEGLDAWYLQAATE